MRYQFLDKITTFNAWESIQTIKNISASEDWASLHFEGFPIMPGALQIEAMAQAVGALIEISENYSVRTMLLVVNKTKFRKTLHPGDTMTIKAKIVSRNEYSAMSMVEVFCANQLVSTGSFLTGFNKVPDDKLPDFSKKNRAHYEFLMRELIRESQ